MYNAVKGNDILITLDITLGGVGGLEWGTLKLHVDLL